MRGSAFPRFGAAAAVGCALAALVAAPRAHAASRPVVVLHPAPKKHQPGKVTFIDPDTLTVRGAASVEGSPWPLSFDPSGGRLHLWGAPKPGAAALQSKKPWTLSSVDMNSLASTRIGEAGRWPLRHFTDGLVQRLYILDAKPGAKVTPITVFDLPAGKPLGPIAKVEHLVSAAAPPDGRLLYALCEGKPHKRPKGPPGNLHILDAATGAEVARLDVGAGASLVMFEPVRQLTYVLGVVDEEGKGVVTALRGGKTVGRFSVPGGAVALARGPDDVIYALAKGAVVALSADGLTAARTWRVDFHPGDLLFDASHGRMFAGARSGSTIAELDLAGEEVLAEHTTGRGGVKFGQGLGRGLVGLFAVGATLFSGIPVAPVGLLTSGPTSMTVSPDGAMLYVLNPYTNDITLFDPDRRDVVGYVPTGEGSRRIVRAPDDPNFWVESRTQLVRLNTATNKVDRTIVVADSFFNRPAVAYDKQRGRVWILARTTIRVFDLRTGESVGTVELDSPAFGVWIEDSPIALAGLPARP